MVKTLVILACGILVSFYPTSAQEVSFNPKTLSSSGERAYTQLLACEKFSIGHTGYSGERSNEEVALRILLKGKNAISALQSLTRSGTPEARLYGLVGLKVKD